MASRSPLDSDSNQSDSSPPSSVSRRRSKLSLSRTARKVRGGQRPRAEGGLLPAPTTWRPVIGAASGEVPGRALTPSVSLSLSLSSPYPLFNSERGQKMLFLVLLRLKSRLRLATRERKRSRHRDRIASYHWF